MAKTDEVSSPKLQTAIRGLKSSVRVYEDAFARSRVSSRRRCYEALSAMWFGYSGKLQLVQASIRYPRSQLNRQEEAGELNAMALTAARHWRTGYTMRESGKGSATSPEGYGWETLPRDLGAAPFRFGTAALAHLLSDDDVPDDIVQVLPELSMDSARHPFFRFNYLDASLFRLLLGKASQANVLSWLETAFPEFQTRGGLLDTYRNYINLIEGLAGRDKKGAESCIRLANRYFSERDRSDEFPDWHGGDGNSWICVDLQLLSICKFFWLRDREFLSQVDPRDIPFAASAPA